MKRDAWAEKAHITQQAQPPVYDTGNSNHAGNSGYVTTESMRTKPIFTTFDAWQAAYLDVLQIPYLRCEYLNGRPRFYFDNAGDAAWMAGKDFRNGEDALVPISRFRQSYRFMQHEISLAREKGVSYGNDSTPSAA